MATVLVTGGCGYIGGHVVHVLKEAGDKVVIVDDLSYGKASRTQGFPLVVQDVAAPEAPKVLEQVMRLYKVDAVIHFAARKQVGESMARPLWYYRQNVGGLVNVLDAMEAVGVQKMIFSSSAAVYGMPPVEIVREDTPKDPINPYGRTKLIGEWMLEDCGRAWGLKWVALRYFNVAGAGWPDLGDSAVLNLILMVFNNLKKGKAPAIFGDDYPTPDGTCVRDYVHVSDLADAHVAALRYLDLSDADRLYSAFNVGTGSTSVRQIVDEVKKVTGLPFTEKIEKAAPAIRRSSSASERINEVMGWHAKYDVEDIVESAWKAWQANPSTTSRRYGSRSTGDRSASGRGLPDRSRSGVPADRSCSGRAPVRPRRRGRFTASRLFLS